MFKFSTLISMHLILNAKTCNEFSGKLFDLQQHMLLSISKNNPPQFPFLDFGNPPKISIAILSKGRVD